MGPCTHGTYAPIDIRPHGTEARLPQCPKHPDEGLSAIRPGSPSIEERTSQCSSGRRMSNPHVCHSNVPSSHKQSPSKQRITQPGSVTIVPAPDGKSTYERRRPIGSSPHIWGKTPAHCAETPVLADDEQTYGGARLPSQVSASS